MTIETKLIKEFESILELLGYEKRVGEIPNNYVLKHAREIVIGFNFRCISDINVPYTFIVQPYVNKLLISPQLVVPIQSDNILIFFNSLNKLFLHELVLITHNRFSFKKDLILSALISL